MLKDHPLPHVSFVRKGRKERFVRRISTTLDVELHHWIIARNDPSCPILGVKFNVYTHRWTKKIGRETKKKRERETNKQEDKPQIPRYRWTCKRRERMLISWEFSRNFFRLAIRRAVIAQRATCHQYFKGRANAIFFQSQRVAFLLPECGRISGQRVEKWPGWENAGKELKINWCMIAHDGYSVRYKSAYGVFIWKFI